VLLAALHAVIAAASGSLAVAAELVALTTGLAFAALASPWLGFALDRTAALVIVVAVAWMGWGLLRHAMRVLLDASLDAPALIEIRKVIDADPAVAEVKWITGRNAGRFRFVEAGVALRVVELDKAEAAIRRIEAAVRAAVPHAGTLSRHFGEAPFFALVTLRRADGSIGEQRVVANPHQALEKAKGIRVAEWLVAQKIDAVVLREDVQGKGPGYVLRDAGVQLRRTGRTALAEALGENGRTA
jgi:predicted Fe-Mo cluster-binding NifX family protein